MQKYVEDKKWKSKTSKEDGMGKGVDSARVRRNEKSYVYGRKKKENERVWNGSILKLVWEFWELKIWEIWWSKGNIYRGYMGVRCRGVRCVERVCKKYMKRCV